MKTRLYNFLIGLAVAGSVNIICLMCKLEPAKLLKLESWCVILFAMLAGIALLMED